MSKISENGSLQEQSTLQKIVQAQNDIENHQHSLYNDYQPYKSKNKPSIGDGLVLQNGNHEPKKASKLKSKIIKSVNSKAKLRSWINFQST